MRFTNFLKKHWKIASMLMAIVIATTIGVVIVKAATIVLTVDTTNINFTSTSQSVTVNATVSLINATSTNGQFSWSVQDQMVASVSYNEGVGTVSSLAGGKTKLTVGYLLDSEYVSKEIPVTVPLTVAYDSVSGIMQPGNQGTVTSNAASSKTVQWSSANSNIATVVGDGSNATISAVSGGTTTITCSIPADGLQYSFDVTVGVTIDEDSIEVGQGLTKVLTTNSNSVSDVYWWTDNANVCTVSNGVVYGVYAGSTTVYASCRDGDISNNAGDSATVTVPYEVTPPGSNTMLVGDQISIGTTANPVEVNYSSDNNNIISYDPNTGMFTANNTGTANLTVTWNGNTETVTMTVIDGFSLSTTSASLNVGDTVDISAVVSNSGVPVHWSIGDESMASISVSDDTLTCQVTALAVGTSSNSTTLVATQELNGVVKTATCTIYVLNPVNNLTLLYNGNEITSTISLQRGTGVYVTAYLNFGDTVVPDNTTLSWVSSDESVITVTPVTAEGQQQLAQINGVGGGNATITVVSEDGLYIATADFYVTEGVQSISVEPTEVTAQMALQKYQLTATVLPAVDGVDTSVTWATLDPSVVTVDQAGLVTFVGSGETYVSVTSNADNSKVAYCKFLITQQVEDITMDYDRVTMNVGETYRLTAVVSPDDATNKTVYWSSSNEAVVTVDSSGMLTAVGSGSATIIAQTEDGGYIDMTNVTVLQPVTEIKLSETEMTVKKGTEFWLNAEVLPDTADDKSVTWSSSDTSLATVDQTGKVTTLAVGTVTISCVSNDSGVAAYCIVDITDPVTGLTLNSYYQTMVAGTKFVVVPTVLPNDAPDKSVTFTSSDPAIATVDENGVVTALVGGTCDIIVTTNESSLTRTCTIAVTEYVESVEITDAPERMNVGGTTQLGATVQTDTASNKNVYWTSSNTSIATVDQTGRVTGVSSGSVVITATAADGGGASDSVVIKVINPVKTITLDKTKITIYEGDTVNIKATVNPGNATISKLKWTSNDESVAKVYSDGDVTGITAGRTVVHATSTDGNKVVADCTVIVKPIVKATSISINSSEITMLKGKTRKLQARMYPLNSNEYVNWLSTDTSIVTVDAYGNIVTVGAGECEIVAYSSSGTVEDSCIVHSIAMSCTDLTIEQYDTFNLYVDGAPSTVSWRTSNPRIATVDSSGLVTGRMPGECRITGTVDGKTVVCYVKVMATDPGKFINTLASN